MQDHEHENQSETAGSITLLGGVAMGTGVMIGAGIFALTGHIAELAGPLFPLSFIAGALVTSLAAYSYIKMSNKCPSSGCIAMILQKAYGPGVIAASASLLMALSMVINESLVARTFATYALRPFGNEIILMVKGSAVASVVTVYDLMGETRLAFADTFRFDIYFYAAVLYLVLVETLRRVWNVLERTLTRHLDQRRKRDGPIAHPE